MNERAMPCLSPLGTLSSGETPHSPPCLSHQHIGVGSGVQADAARRKRERDKNSQRRKRQRDRDYTKTLEERIQQLERQQMRVDANLAARSPQPPTPVYSSVSHDEGDLGSHTQLWLDRNQFNSAALPDAPQHSLRPAAEFPDALTTPTPSISSTQSTRVSRPWPADHDTPERADQDRRRRTNPPTGTGKHTANSTSSRSTTVTVPLGVLEGLLASPQWLRLPLHGLSLTMDARTCVRGSPLPAFIREARADPATESLCPPQPKIIDILFGGSKNVLANLIVTECSKEALLSPEKFAISWMLYLYCKWLIWPSKESFALLPKHFHPSTRQITVEHPWCIDLAIWPVIRENMIKYQSRHDIDAVLGLLLCTSRIRGFFNSSFITRENDGDLQLDAQFHEKFLNPHGWGLLERFWIEYPDLVEGLDPSIMIREEDLIAT